MQTAVVKPDEVRHAQSNRHLPYRSCLRRVEGDNVLFAQSVDPIAKLRWGGWGVCGRVLQVRGRVVVALAGCMRVHLSAQRTLRVRV